MTGLLIVLAVLVCVAFRLRPNKHVRKKPDGSTWISRDGKGWDDPA